jgi:hypothetical protein
MRAWRTRRCSAPPTAARTGTSSRACAATAPVRSGSRARAAWSAHHHSRSPDPKRIYIAISAAGAFRTDDGGKTWKPINKGLRSQFIPDPDAEVGHCVHHVAMHRSRPDVLFMQKHWDVMRTDDAGENWREVSGNLPTDFGFAIDVHAHEPETLYVVPIKSDSEHFPLDGKLRVYRSRTGGNEWEPLAKGLPEKDCYVNVLRDAMAVDTLDECGVYFGTTGGQVYASADRAILGADRARSAGGAFGRSADAELNRDQGTKGGTRSKRVTPCCAEPFAITRRASGARFCASLPAKKTGRWNLRTKRCPTRWQREMSRC